MNLIFTRSLGVALLAAIVGCAGTASERELRMTRGYVYYCDGAGGGGLINWSGGLRAGLREGGYPGTGKIFAWNTGLGVVPDQNASVAYKRRKARQMAQAAAAYAEQYPGAPVTFIGLSAGTSVVVFGLEEMPAGTTVDNAVLCGASISSTYDLTRALRHLDGKMYVFTSSKDPVLGFLVPMAGTADRASGSVPAAGLRGFRMPRSAGPETRKQYAKVVTVPWRPEFARLGYHGGHSDVLSRQFVAAHIAPRITKQVGSTPTALASTKGKVRNPDYERWSKYGVGTYLVLRGYQEYRGERSPLRVRVTLISKSGDRLMVRREFFFDQTGAATPAAVRSLIAETWIDPRRHPTTDPAAVTRDLPAKTITVEGRSYRCTGKSILADGNYPGWGSRLTARAYRCPDLPGMAEITLDSHFAGEPFKFEGRLVEFEIVPEG